jgi:hypothetical protein
VNRHRTFQASFGKDLGVNHAQKAQILACNLEGLIGTKAPSKVASDCMSEMMAKGDQLSTGGRESYRANNASFG